MFPLIEALEAGPVNVSAVEGGQGDDADAARLGRSSPLANCTLIARKAVTTVKQQGPSEETVVLTWAFTLERVTGIEPHYQLGNLCRPGLSHGLTCGTGHPRVTVRDSSSPGLMAR
jgi:hypothetical protein